ncbi:MAG: tRNA uridine-5-carboxymethylaminomethyl(34) synthesis GTPase MnmE [Bacteroidota bacterium]
MNQWDDTIVALSTPAGVGALGVVRLSGPEAIAIAGKLFSKPLGELPGRSLVYGHLIKEEQILDDVLLSLFRGPKSYTKEDTVEISCHGSSYILQEVIQLLQQAGARLALPGEFTQRAYLNGSMDLAQAEAVADLIASTSAGAHQLAMNQMRGGVSDELKKLRTQLLDFTSLIELELDFGEEDVEFADRSQLSALISEMQQKLGSLIDSFTLGNAIKRGVPTVILGKPNAGKSTLLNALLRDDRAIVSDIPGTTRDVVEDRVIIEGIEFRLQDTAGVRETEDVIEKEGVSRSLKLAQKAALLIYLFDLQTESPDQAQQYIDLLGLPEQTHVLLVGNKIDLISASFVPQKENLLFISAKEGASLQALQQQMVQSVRRFAHSNGNQAIISNARHLAALEKAKGSLDEVQQGMEYGVSGDLLAIDIRTVLHHIGEITGEISTDEVLGNIFSKFCIGK